MPLAFAVDANASATALGNGLADVEAKASSLNVLVEFDKAVEDHFLLLLGDAGSRVLTIDVQSILLVAVAHLDVTFLGELHSVSHKVSDNLLNASYVECGFERAVGILLDEGESWVSDARLQHEANVVEGHGKIDGCGTDGVGPVGDGGCLEDVVDEAHEHVAGIAHNAYVLLALLGGCGHAQHVGEAHDGVQRGAQLVGHGGHEAALQLAGGLGPLGDLGKLAAQEGGACQVVGYAPVAYDVAVGVVERR